MKRMFSLTVLAALLTALVSVSPGASVLAAPKFDLVVGTGRLDLGSEHGAPYLHVNAKDTDSGAKGHFVIEYLKGDARFPAGGYAEGEITCMDVSGNITYLVGQVTKSSLQIFGSGQYVHMTVVDNGEPGTSDAFNFTTSNMFDPGCTTGPAPIPVVEGNFQIFDYNPEPVCYSVTLVITESENPGGASLVPPPNCEGGKYLEGTQITVQLWGDVDGVSGCGITGYVEEPTAGPFTVTEDCTVTVNILL